MFGWRSQLREQVQSGTALVVTAAARIGQTAADAGVLVDEHDLAPARAAASAAEILMGRRRPPALAEVVALGCDDARRIEIQLAEAAHVADQPLPVREQPLRPVERLVVEADRQKAREPVEEARAIALRPRCRRC